MLVLAWRGLGGVDDFVTNNQGALQNVLVVDEEFSLKGIFRGDEAELLLPNPPVDSASTRSGDGRRIAGRRIRGDESRGLKPKQEEEHRGGRRDGREGLGMARGLVEGRL